MDPNKGKRALLGRRSNTIDARFSLPTIADVYMDLIGRDPNACNTHIGDQVTVACLARGPRRSSSESQKGR